MNQYIITEELRDLVMYRLGNEGYTDLKWRIKKETESRPYNPQAEQCAVSTCIETIKRTRKDEREKVLDKWRKWMKDNTSGISSESYQEGIIRIMQLREGKDGE